MSRARVTSLVAALSNHSWTRGRADCQNRVQQFLGKHGYVQGSWDTPQRAMVFVHDHTVEQFTFERKAESLNRELLMRREILVNNLGIFHPSDPAWLLPGVIVLLSHDSPDGRGRDGKVVRDMDQWKGFMSYSPSEVSSGEAQQAFEAGGRRLPAQWVEWSRWAGDTRPVVQRLVKFPAQVPAMTGSGRRTGSGA